ncbi:MAG: prepilin-type N-terminal cleavage/methylation domain-containing protein [Spirochaetia bacterium]|nr:prepilin-type N-terminal cleavage/methylation domain-containing protein [Spirochaetota bacterium]MCX8096739.1 prepilin-type N-terminal cleavage/methylation domain-containing protein [Spirochaetota bacterium]MDW8112154.1 prepilin-type N-terminal cleavage/methylation domain-containing protein [Spirochaetia bacterium]
MNSRAFSLVEVMVVVMLSSVVFLVIYSLTSVGIRFFENFSKNFDFSINQFLRDVEFELLRADEFRVDGGVLEIRLGDTFIRYIQVSPSKDFSLLTIRKEIISRGVATKKTFTLRNVFELKMNKQPTSSRNKLYISILDVNGRYIYMGYIP